MIKLLALAIALIAPIHAGAQTAAPSAKVYFDFDRTDITPEAAAILDALVVQLNQRSYRAIRIEGHTDMRPTADYALPLSERMAQSARSYLETHGVPAGKIVTIAYGKSRPQDRKRQALNRRVEVRVSWE